MRDTGVRPVVKWAGGKRRLLGRILPLIPEDIGTYCEPFVGGGAVWLAAGPRSAIVNDKNTDLVALYWTLGTKKTLEALLDLLRSWPDDPDFYAEVRGWDLTPDYLHRYSNIQRAARLVYLNRTCFNGLFRVNANGHFNVPYNKMDQGRRRTFDEEKLRAAGEYIRAATVMFLNEDFAESMDMIQGSNGFCYIDPPYDSEDPSSFTSYQGKFDRDEQRRLKEACDKATSRKIRFLASNADTPFIRELYKGYDIISIQAPRSISADGGKRKKAGEVLIKNY